MDLKLLYRTSLKLKSNKLFSKSFDELEKKGMMLVVFIVYLRLFANIYFSFGQIRRGLTPAVLQMLAFNYLHLFVIVTVFSFLLSSMDESLICFNFKRLKLINLPRYQLYLLQLFTLVNNPILLLVGLFVLTATFPLLILPGLPLALFALLNSVAGLFFLSWGMAFLINAIPGSTLIKRGIKLLFIFTIIFIVTANCDFRLRGEGAYILSFEKLTKLNIPLWWPLYSSETSHLLKGALFSFLFLTLSFAFSYIAFLALIRVSVRRREKVRLKRGVRLYGKGRTIFTILFKKEILHLLSRPGFTLSLFASISITGYLLRFDNLSIQAALFLLLLVMLFNYRSFTHCFHNDTMAIKRYKLYAVRWANLLKAKNLALFTILLIQLFPVIVGAIVFLPPAIPLKLVTITILITAAYFSWGNFISIFTGTFLTGKSNDNYLLNQLMGPAITFSAFYLFFYLERYSLPIELALSIAAVTAMLGAYLFIFRKMSAYLAETV